MNALMEERCLGTRNLLVNYTLRKARIVLVQKPNKQTKSMTKLTKTKTVQLSDTDQNNPTSGRAT